MSDERLIDALLAGDLDALERELEAPAEDRALLEAFHSLGLMAEPVSAPPPAPRISEPPSLAGPLAEVFQVDLATATRYLARIAENAWEQLAPGIGLLHFTGGPATEGADVGFVRVQAGRPFPLHTHLGPEAVLILAGTLIDEDGTVLRMGDIARADGGSHRFRAGPGTDLIYAVVVFGVRFDEPFDTTPARED